MKNYNQFEAEDFVQDPYFRKWVLGKLPPEDNFWPAWQAANTLQYEAIEKARTMIIAFTCEDIPVDQQEIRAGIDAILSDSGNNTRAFYQKMVWKIAASILFLLSLGYVFLKQNIFSDSGISLNLTDDLQEINEGSQPRSFRLSDSTLVTLFPKSKLRIDTDFGKKKREVYLSGEAFFTVARNTEKPFFVYTGDVVTKVLGTSFKIKAFSTDENVSVAVSTGKVTVFKQKNGAPTSHALSDEIILAPNQQAVYEKSGERLVKTLVENPVILHGETGADVLEFVDTPVPKVLYELEKAYGIKIVFDELLLHDCNFTARLTTEPLFEKLNLICETIQARYEIVDGQVVIYAKKCQ
ncbi:FecR family protein [Dyadobacter sp. CY312]|uniref:FecR family protein n=1 Tax=Dyadobacter sp. CY312 TaxID=2907303 RepID=UPI001F2F0943|nr:FecR family protein [Dyadobacter sp. CY312]MCE7042600.1 FecR family protein [Dyadobacter sp. CY312]